VHKTAHRQCHRLAGEQPPAALATNENDIALRYDAVREAINTALALGASDTPSTNAKPITTTSAAISEKLKAPVSYAQESGTRGSVLGGSAVTNRPGIPLDVVLVALRRADVCPALPRRELDLLRLDVS